jgi:cystathionine beta-lyase
VDDRIKPSVITMLSCTKTFNIAQSGMAFLVSENPSYIQKIRDSLTANHLGAPNVFASVMAQAGFTYGANWLDQVIAYVWENYRFIQRILTEKMPKIILMPLEGTYLIWLDGRKLQVPIADFFENDAHVLGVDGKLFGDEGEGYYRINIAAPRKTIKKMLKKLEMAYNNLTD